MRPGALKDLKDALYDLYLRADGPTMEEIAGDIATWADRYDLEGSPSRDTVHRILSDAALPQEPRDVVAIAAILASHLNLDVPAVREQIHRLWRRAVEQPSAGWRMAGPDDPRGHFTSRAQGYQGWVHGEDRFRGRHTALTAVKVWLLARETPSRPLVITGQPGAGKSAVLARTVMELEAGTSTVGVAIHARNATVDHVIAGVALAAGMANISSSHELLDGLKKRDPKAAKSDSTLVVAVDALDEVPDDAQRRQIATLLTDLALVAPLRVVVATRALSARDRFATGSLLSSLGVRGENSDNLVDLDSERYRDPTGLREFVIAVLASRGSYPPSPYLDHPSLSGRLADVIVRRAGSNYLVAALAATPLTSRDEVIDPDLPGFDAALIPSTVGEAITKYLDRLAERKAITLALLTALAYARGGGIEHDRWLEFCVALGYPATHLDIDVLRDSPAADYLLQTITNEQRLITRLFHQALTDELLKRREGMHRRDERAIAQTLLPSCARYWHHTGRPTAANPRDWFDLDDYAHEHLPAHAAIGDMLDDLVTDPGFMLSSPPHAVLRHRAALSRRDAVAAAAALAAAVAGVWRDWGERNLPGRSMSGPARSARDNWPTPW